MTFDNSQSVTIVKTCRHGEMIFLRGDTYIGDALDRYGEFSELESTVFEQLVKPGFTVVEAGANIGAHTVHLAKLVGPQGIVMAFEPQRILFQLLCANAMLNSHFNIHPKLAGVGQAAGMAKIPPIDYTKGGNFGGVSLLGQEQGEDVPVVTIDSLSLPSLHLLKVDVEGMEVDVLKGAEKTIQRLRPILYIENDRKEKAPEVIKLIDSMGYDMWWHTPPLFNPDNYRKVVENIYPGLVSINMLCFPKERAINIDGLRKVDGPTSHWK